MPDETRPPVDTWFVLQLRLTAFPSEPMATQKRDWWAELFGGPAESTTIRAPTRTDEGKLDGHQLTFYGDLDRLQWTWTPFLNPASPPEVLPTLGPFSRCIERFSETMEHWLATRCPEVGRLALGVVLVQFTEATHEACYRRLGAYLRSASPNPNSTDFIFRVNWRRPNRSSVDGLEINRLSEWSAIKWQLGVQSQSPSGETSRMPLGEGVACKVELDINTGHEFHGPLPQDRLPAIWHELIDYATEIARDGETP